MAVTQANSTPKQGIRGFMSANLFQNQGVLVFVVLIVVFLAGSIIFGSTFYSGYNITTMLVFNSMFAFISLGMTFVIITGGIDLSVSSVAVLTSMLAAWFSRFGLLPAIFVPVIVGTLIGLFNGWTISKLGILPFIATLVTFMAARGLALIMPKIFGIYLANLFPNVSWNWVEYVADYSIVIDRSQNFQAIIGNFLGSAHPGMVNPHRLHPGGSTAAVHAFRQGHPGNRRQRRSCPLDGLAGYSHQDPGVCHERRPRRTGRRNSGFTQRHRLTD